MEGEEIRLCAIPLCTWPDCGFVLPYERGVYVVVLQNDTEAHITTPGTGSNISDANVNTIPGSKAEEVVYAFRIYTRAQTRYARACSKPLVHRISKAADGVSQNGEAKSFDQHGDDNSDIVLTNVLVGRWFDRVSMH